MISKTLMAGLLLLACIGAHAQKAVMLYEGKIPNSKEAANEERHVGNALVDSVAYDVSVPTLSIFAPAARRQQLRPAVIICPGGGYHALLTRREGSRVAEAFNKAGVAAFVLKYRLPSDRIMVDKAIGPMQDVQEAVKYVRDHASQWHIDPRQIGVMGFSAGGHLASLSGTHYDRPVIDNGGTSLRPDFLVLINPVISFTDSIAEKGSRASLLGPDPADSLKQLYSSELQIRADGPPAFLVHCVEDSVVRSANSLNFYLNMHALHLPVELHLYEKGEHGFLSAPPFEEWFPRCLYWMRSNGWLVK